MLTAGIDIGSMTTKGAIVEDGRVLATRVIFTGYNAGAAGEAVLSGLLESLRLERGRVDRVVATGYGRKAIPFAHATVTEITCHAAGAHYLDPRVRAVIDIGGQDSKAIALDPHGKVRDFAMNDKCAAGTGRFLEVMARAMEVDLDAFGDLALRSGEPAQISSTCTVFAESEVVSLIAGGAHREDIVAGIHEAVAARVVAMARRLGLNPPIMMTGGVAKNRGVVRALEHRLGAPVQVSPHAQENGAIGAALLAAARM